MFNLVLVICLALFFSKYPFLISLYKIQLNLIRITKRENFMILWNLIEYFIYLWTFLSQSNRNRALFCKMFTGQGWHMYTVFLSSFKFHLLRFRRLLPNYICLQSTQSGLDISTYLYFRHLKTFHLNEIFARRPLYFCVINF